MWIIIIIESIVELFYHLNYIQCISNTYQYFSDENNPNLLPEFCKYSTYSRIKRKKWDFRKYKNWNNSVMIIFEIEHHCSFSNDAQKNTSSKFPIKFGITLLTVQHETENLENEYTEKSLIGVPKVWMFLMSKKIKKELFWMKSNCFVWILINYQIEREYLTGYWRLGMCRLRTNESNEFVLKVWIRETRDPREKNIRRAMMTKKTSSNRYFPDFNIEPY